MWKKWKLMALPFTALFAVLLMLFRGRNPWEERAKKAQGEATAAKIEAANANAALDKEKIKHEMEQALDDLDSMADDELAAAVLEEYRRRGSGAGGGQSVEDSGADH